MIGEFYPPSSQLVPTVELGIAMRLSRWELDGARDPQALAASVHAILRKALLRAGARALNEARTERRLDGGMDVFMTGFAGYWRPE